MMFDIIIIFVVGIFVLLAVYTVRGKFPQRTVDDVAPYLRAAESGELEALLDPGQEANFRIRMSPREFALWQRRRIHLLREYLLRMSHNSLVLIEWGNLESLSETRDPEQSMKKQLLAKELVQAATEFRLYSLLALLQLKFWLLLPSPVSSFFPSLSLPQMRHLCGIDALGSYQRLKSAASGLSLAYNNHFHDELVELL